MFNTVNYWPRQFIRNWLTSRPYTARQTTISLKSSPIISSCLEFLFYCFFFFIFIFFILFSWRFRNAIVANLTSLTERGTLTAIYTHTSQPTLFLRKLKSNFPNVLRYISTRGGRKKEESNLLFFFLLIFFFKYLNCKTPLLNPNRNNFCS